MLQPLEDQALMCIPFTQAVITQHFDDPAALRRAPLTCRDHTLELLFKCSELLEARLDGCEIVAGDGVSAGAMSFRMIGEVQEGADLVEFKPQLSGMADESEALQRGIAIEAAPALRTRRRGQKPLRLIKAYGRDF